MPFWICGSITDGLSDLFAREHIPVNLIHAHEQGISFAVENWPGLAEILRKVDASVDITVEEDRAAIWLVGEGIAHVASTLARACAVLRIADVRLTSQGSSSLSLGFAIREADLQLAMEALHREFFLAPDRNVFAVAECIAVRAPQPASRAGHLRQTGQPQAAPAH